MNIPKVSVIGRVRPFILKEENKNSIEIIGGSQCLIGGNKYALDSIRAETTQSDFFFGWISTTVDEFISGVNGVIVAYGQTASGKTYTMRGGSGLDNEGVIPRAIRRIFQDVSEPIEYSFVEIYNEKIFDLLNMRKIVNVMNDGTLNGAVKNVASKFSDIMNAFIKGEKLRRTCSTQMNQSSSRSHSILKLKLKKAELSFIDLAGSETVKKTEASGEALREAGFINNSLSSLALVIKQIALNSTYINYRNSKLTQTLKRSLEGNTRVTMIINLSPSLTHLKESINSLRFAESAKKITVTVKDDLEDEIMELYKVKLKEYHKRCTLELMLEKVKRKEPLDVEKLQSMFPDEQLNLIERKNRGHLLVEKLEERDFFSKKRQKIADDSVLYLPSSEEDSVCWYEAEF